MAFCSTTQFGVTLLAVCLFTIIIVLLNLVGICKECNSRTWSIKFACSLVQGRFI